MEISRRFEKVIGEKVGLTTFPIAVRLLKQGEDIPVKVERPLRAFGEPIRPCEGWNLTRRQGFPIAMLEEDFSTACPTGMFVFGILEPIKSWIEGDLAYDVYASSREAAVNMERNVFRLEAAKYKGVVFSPLGKADFTPDLVMIYCNSMQAMRLVAAAEWEDGEPLRVSIAARNLCADGIVQPFQTGRPVLAIPCGGDRENGRTQDTEVVFTTPVDRLEGIIGGLELATRSHRIEKLGEGPNLLERYMKMAKVLDEKLGRSTP